MDFSALQSALADVNTAEKALESLSAADDTAQQALVNAQTTAQATAQAKAAGVTAFQQKVAALDTAASAVEGQLTPAPPPVTPPAGS